MPRKVEIESVDVSELQDLITVAVERATSALRREVEQLRTRLHEERSVITHREAPAYFAGEVSEARIREYVRGKDLPAGMDIPLPARKQGRVYFIDVETLQRWQLGRCTEADLFPWQRPS